MSAPVRVLDAHVHFWDPTRFLYPWLGGVPALARPYLPPDFPPFGRDASGSPDHEARTGVLFVEANCVATDNEGEVAFVERCAAAEPRIRGIIAFVDLLDEKRRRDVLARLRETPRVRGVRHNVQGRAEGFATQPPFVAGVNEVGRAGFTFDLCCTADQLPEVTQLASQCPGTRIVLDHCAKPAIARGDFAPWADDLVALASHDHVSCKLSGLLTEAGPDRSQDADLAPFAEHALQCFGASRLIYGSDWPVCTLGGGVERWRRFVDGLTATWTTSDREAFYAGNAQRIYGVTFDD